MLRYTVMKPGGVKGREYAAYTRYLETLFQFKVANLPRVPSPTGEKRWLYSWTDKHYAESAAESLRQQTRDARWIVYEVETAREECGPVAPLEVTTVPERGGYTYYLTPASRERLVAAHRGMKLPPNVWVSIEKHEQLLRQEGCEHWIEMSHALTGRADEEIDALGGLRVVVGLDEVAYERIPTASSH